MNKKYRLIVAKMSVERWLPIDFLGVSSQAWELLQWLCEQIAVRHIGQVDGGLWRNMTLTHIPRHLECSRKIYGIWWIMKNAQQIGDNGSKGASSFHPGTSAKWLNWNLVWRPASYSYLTPIRLCNMYLWRGKKAFENRWRSVKIGLKVPIYYNIHYPYAISINHTPFSHVIVRISKFFATNSLVISHTFGLISTAREKKRTKL